jgi:hypothetical protein
MNSALLSFFFLIIQTTFDKTAAENVRRTGKSKRQALTTPNELFQDKKQKLGKKKKKKKKKNTTSSR